MRSYSPGGRLNNYSTALPGLTPWKHQSLHHLQLGLLGYLIRFAPPAFVPHRRTRFGKTPWRFERSDIFGRNRSFATVSPSGLNAFYRYPRSTSSLPRSQTPQYPLHALPLSGNMSQRTYRVGYERFRPNIRGYHSRRWCYRGGCHQSCPHPYSPSLITGRVTADVYTRQKALARS